MFVCLDRSLSGFMCIMFEIINITDSVESMFLLAIYFDWTVTMLAVL